MLRVDVQDVSFLHAVTSDTLSSLISFGLPWDAVFVLVARKFAFGREGCVARHMIAHSNITNRLSVGKKVRVIQMYLLVDRYTTTIYPQPQIFLQLLETCSFIFVNQFFSFALTR